MGKQRDSSQTPLRDLSVGTLIVIFFYFSVILCLCFFFLIFMRRMNLSVVLLLTAVMVTAKRDKVDDAKSNKVDRQSTDLTGLDLDTLAGGPPKDCPPWVSGCPQKAKSGLTKMMQKEDRASLETDDGMRMQMDTMKADISSLKAAHEAMKKEQGSLKAQRNWKA